MEDPKTIKMGSGEPEERPTVHADEAPFVRMPLPGSGQPASPQGEWTPPPPAGMDSATILMTGPAQTVFAWLVVLDGPEKGRIHPLKADATLVGRLADNDIVIVDDACSGQHLKITVSLQENGELQYRLIDMASRNGVFVGDKETYRDALNRVYRHDLQDGDYLLVGETTLVFKCI